MSERERERANCERGECDWSGGGGLNGQKQREEKSARFARVSLLLPDTDGFLWVSMMPI